jgi:predicted secreted protein
MVSIADQIAPPSCPVMARCAGAFAVLLACMGPAAAGDAAARRFIGFSPDGKVFAFEQYTTLYEDEAAFSEYVIIDTEKDRFVPGAPVRVLIRGDDGLDETKARADAETKAKPLLTKFNVGEPGSYIGGQPSMDLDDIGIYQQDPKPLAKSLDVPLPGGRKARLTVAGVPLGSARCAGYGGRGTAGRAKVAGLKLTMSLDGAAPLVLQQDKTLPKGRSCAADYGIAEAYLHTAPDGTLTLAALIEYADNQDYHAGPNRRFMAVTKRLPKS